jgi:hypothetical protein
MHVLNTLKEIHSDIFLVVVLLHLLLRRGILVKADFQ